jgi:hypothetical protein
LWDESARNRGEWALVRQVLWLSGREVLMAFRGAARFRTIGVVGGLVPALLLVGHARDAEACGCFTPPDPSVPVVQAGERIVFATQGGMVEAHIQIQYAGDAKEFGWLLPLPSVPTLELGTDELFNSLVGTTQPKYRLVQQYDGNCGFNPGNFINGRAGGGPTAVPGASGDATGGMSPLVIQDSIGPFDYAVLRADSKDDMLAWLETNRYFVPAGTDQTVGAYIRPGAFFLALKLRSGRSAGDLQPVVLRYPSDLPMIPIVLTSVAAQPNMGVQVWMLGAGRAIPRNYYHTVINDLAIDWATSGQNYNDVIIKAVGQAPGKHSFVTEYAGTSDVMKNVLTPAGRFGSTAELGASLDAVTFVEYLASHGFSMTGQLVAILSAAIPLPDALIASVPGLTPAQFYANIRYYRNNYATAFTAWPSAGYEPQALAMEIEQKVVKPTVAASDLFNRFPYLTRLYTTLSPEDMTLDPVFSYNHNRTLPDVANVHQATLTYYCGFGSADRTKAPARLVTEQGWTVDFPKGTGLASVPPPPSAGLAPRRLEILREEGAPEVVMDNVPSNGSGCACQIGSGGGNAAAASGLGAAAALAAAAVLRLRRRRGRAGSRASR